MSRFNCENFFVVEILYNILSPMNFGECIFLKIFSNQGCSSAFFAVGRVKGSFKKHFFKKSKSTGEVFQNFDGE